MNKPQMAWDELEWIANKNIKLKWSHKKKKKSKMQSLNDPSVTFSEKSKYAGITEGWV